MSEDGQAACFESCLDVLPEEQNEFSTPYGPIINLLVKAIKALVKVVIKVLGKAFGIELGLAKQCHRFGCATLGYISDFGTICHDSRFDICNEIIMIGPYEVCLCLFGRLDVPPIYYSSETELDTTV